MEMIFKSWKKCIITSRDSNDYIRQWTDSRTDNTTIEMALFIRFPFLSYSVINSTHYRWCGPMLYIAEYLAKLTNNRIRLNPYVPNPSSIMQNLFMTNLSLVLTPLSTGVYKEFVVKKRIDNHIKLSSYIDFTDNSKILALTKKGKLLYFTNKL